MSYDSFFITKRDGKQEPFSLEKIKSAILKASVSTGTQADNDTLQKVVDHLRFCNGM